MPWRASIGRKTLNEPFVPMTLSVAGIAEDTSPMRGLLPLWVGVFIYALFLLAGNRRLFLHHARPALDLDPVAGAGALRQGLCGRGLERAGGACSNRDRRDV